MILSVAFALALSVGVAPGQITPAAENYQFRAVSVIKGSTSSIHKPQYVLVTNQAQWDSLWKRHSVGMDRKKQTPPIVDFSKHQVVAIFEGSAWNSNGIAPGSIGVVDGQTRVRFNSERFQTAGPDGGGVRCSAFGMFVLPRFGRLVRLEENVQGIIGKPPIWKYRATLRP